MSSFKKIPSFWKGPIHITTTTYPPFTEWHSDQAVAHVRTNYCRPSLDLSNQLTSLAPLHMPREVALNHWIPHPMWDKTRVGTKILPAIPFDATFYLLTNLCRCRDTHTRFPGSTIEYRRPRLYNHLPDKELRYYISRSWSSVSLPAKAISLLYYRCDPHICPPHYKSGRETALSLPPCMKRHYQLILWHSMFCLFLAVAKQ